jgi:nicotinamide-nucleotide amidase
MESVVLDMLRQRGWSLGLAESVTGGLVGARLTGIPGSSDVFRGAVVSYSTDVKQTVLGVSEGPVVSEPAALEMARGARRVLGSDVALALTGVAGPAEQDGMPAGTLCIGLVWPDGELTRTLRLPGRREQMRQFSVISSLDLLRRSLT